MSQVEILLGRSRKICSAIRTSEPDLNDRTWLRRLNGGGACQRPLFAAGRFWCGVVRGFTAANPTPGFSGRGTGLCQMAAGASAARSLCADLRSVCKKRPATVEQTHLAQGDERDEPEERFPHCGSPYDTPRSGLQSQGLFGDATSLKKPRMRASSSVL